MPAKTSLIGNDRRGGYAVQRLDGGLWKTQSVKKFSNHSSVRGSLYLLVFGQLDDAIDAFNSYAEALDESKANHEKNFSSRFAGGFRVIGLKTKKVYAEKKY